MNGHIGRYDSTLGSGMMVEKERLGKKMVTNMEDTRGYQKSGIRLA